MHTRTVFILICILSKKGSSRTRSMVPSSRDSRDSGGPSCRRGKTRRGGAKQAWSGAVGESKKHGGQVHARRLTFLLLLLGQRWRRPPLTLRLKKPLPPYRPQQYASVDVMTTRRNCGSQRGAAVRRGALGSDSAAWATLETVG